MSTRREDLTFRYNLKQDRHGWVRLTPAYSVKIVQDLLAEHPSITHALDPFSGTGTTGLVCATAGLKCDLIDINPFLVWLAGTKTANYATQEVEQLRHTAHHIVDEARRNPKDSKLWTPPISNVERWWKPNRLTVLAKLFHALSARFPHSSPVKDLLLVAFCRLLIQWSNAAFNHQSMSFKATHQLAMFSPDSEEEEIYQTYLGDVDEIASGAGQFVKGQVRVFQGDSRCVQLAADSVYDAVITSPPYPNRMSYIRELRPYMYWLGYLTEANQAGELDWQAIGGTWGVATSRLQTWTPDNGLQLSGIQTSLDAIARQSSLLANYVHKYFVDMATHFRNMRAVLSPNARLFYVVGNSKFYETVVPVEQYYADLMWQLGYSDVSVQPIRKRNSKKELFEYLVSCRAP